MKTQLRLIASTIVLTVLIWIYANQASHSTTTLLVPVKLALAETGGSWALRVADAPADQPNTRQVKLTVRGPKQAIRMLESETGQGRFALTVKLAEQLTPGKTNSRNLYADLSGSPDLLQRGLNLQSVMPEVIEFEVDRYIRVPVEFKPEAGAFKSALVGQPTLAEKVTARVLESKVGKDFAVYPLVLPLEDAIREAFDKRRTEEAAGPLSLHFPVQLQSLRLAVDADFEPPVVHVTVELKDQSSIERKTVRPLSVMVRTQDFFEGYEIEWEDKTGAQFTQSINCRVPVSKLDAFRQIESTGILAYVIIDSSDLPPEPTTAGPTATTVPAPTTSATYRPKQVHFVFPPGFEDIKPVGPPPTVNLRVNRKTTDATGLPTPAAS
ncbi:MAG TPA: hypothetical protein PLL20_00895 [Phycisphaerae bacterium]|nr:hypothetical protein [Phycisphaerae bacterium]HRR86615.1 hypothetical protein [Phycisphaerae bacterium]